LGFDFGCIARLIFDGGAMTVDIDVDVDVEVRTDVDAEAEAVEVEMDVVETKDAPDASDAAGAKRVLCGFAFFPGDAGGSEK